MYALIRGLVKRTRRAFRIPDAKLRYFLLLIRWTDWKDVRIPFVFICVLFFQYTDGVLGAGWGAYSRFFLIFLSSLFYLAFLFLVNDIVDYDQDVRSKHKDGTRSRLFMIGTSVVLLTAGICTAIAGWNEISARNVGILLGSYALAFFYSAPPLRFKERGIWGILIGSIVLRPISVLIAVTGFLLPRHYVTLGIFLLWIEVFSIRSMLFHQIDDYESDMMAGVKTLVTHKGVRYAKQLISSVYFPAELITLMIVSVHIFPSAPLAGGMLLAAALLAGTHYKTRDMFHRLQIAHYRPLLGSMAFFLLPMLLAVMVAAKYSLWLIPVFVLYWQRTFGRELVARIVTKLR